MADFLFDDFNGPLGEPLTSHVPELGGTPLVNASRGTSDYRLQGANNAQVHTITESLLYYPAPPPSPDYLTTATLTLVSTANLTSCGIVARCDATNYTGVILRWEQASSSWHFAIVLNGGLVTDAFYADTLTAGVPVTIEIETLGAIATAIVNGVALGTLPLTAIPAAGFVGLNGQATSLIGQSMLISELHAATLITPPATIEMALLNKPLQYAVYTPTDGVTLQKITLYATPQNIIIKGPQADIIWAWVQANTPPDLVFGPQ